MLTKVRAWWNSLPHQQQALIMLVGGAAIAAAKHGFVDAHGCLTSVCLKGYLWAGIHGGVAAVIALYIPANLGKLTAPPQV
jgi:hypothetical protein